MYIMYIYIICIYVYIYTHTYIYIYSRIRGSRACMFSVTAGKGPAPGRAGINSGLSTTLRILKKNIYI